jgi:hypothetical protein
MEGVYPGEMMKKEKQQLRQDWERLNERIQDLKIQRRNMPDINFVKRPAEYIHRQLVKKNSGKQRLGKMTFEEKPDLLLRLFDGKVSNGEPHRLFLIIFSNVMECC